MKKIQISASKSKRPCRVPFILGVLLSGVVLLSTPVAKAGSPGGVEQHREDEPPTTTVTKKQRSRRDRLHIKASVPTAVPFGYSQSVGVGFAASAQLFIHGGWGLQLTSGFIQYWDKGKDPAKEVPVLLGISYHFQQVSRRATPYVEARFGYTHHSGAEETAHWASALVGGGVWIHLKDGWALDVGADITVPDLQGDFRGGAGLLFRLGMGYEVL